jgi:hypothetical protein
MWAMLLGYERKNAIKKAPEPMKPSLDIDSLLASALTFAEAESIFDEPTLYGVTDGKRIGTYVEHKFRLFLDTLYSYLPGNSASGIDFPELYVDLKVTSIAQPQSSCPFRSARQKIFGLGYHLLIFVYDKADDHVARTGRLLTRHVIFVHRDRTADYQMTRGILEMLERDANADDLVAYIMDRNLPVDDIQARGIAEEILLSPPQLGFLTISNALQWRLQYSRIIQEAGRISGVIRVL